MVPLIRQITSRKSNERSNPIQQAIISLHWMAEFWNFTCLLCGYICLKIYPVPQPGTGYGSAMSGGLVSGSVINLAKKQYLQNISNFKAGPFQMVF